MLEYLNYGNAPVIITALLISLLLITIIVIKRSYTNKNKITEEFIESINVMSGRASMNNTNTKVKEKKETPLDKWNDFWGIRFKKAGLVSYNDYTNNQIGLAYLTVNLVIYFLCLIAFHNYGIGLIPIMSIMLFLTLWLDKKVEEKQEIFDEQIPVFLSLLKSNIQAGETPEAALLGAIDEIDAPLYNELKQAKALIELGSFQVALQTLRKNTYNDTLKFLCGCIELSSSVGANLEDQIETIEGMLESNRVLKRKLKVAASKNTPLLIVSAILIPGVFCFMYFSNQQMRDFWFKVPLSWIAFFGVIAVYGGGTYLVKRMVRKTGEF